MNEAEKQLFHSCRKLLESNVDPIMVLDGLYQHGYLSGNQRKIIYEISRTNQDRTYIWKALLLLIPGSCELECVLNVLLDAGYSEIAMAIGQKLRMSIVPSAQDLRIHRTNTGDSSQRFAQKLFMNFKINTHNNAFVNPRTYCHEESQKYKIQLEGYNGVDDDVRRGIADKYAACLLAEIDSHIMLYTRQFPTCDLIKRLKLLIPETSNSNITQLSYDSRLAMSCALAGKEGEAEDHLQSAMGLSFFIGRCVEISNLLYIYVFSLLSAYEKCPTQKLRDKIIHIAELGLQSVEDETDSIREFWVRIFTLRIVYCLLGLSYRGDPIYGIIIHRFNIRKAKQLLTDIDKQWEKMESRRKIMYYVAKARIAELEHNYGYIDSVLHFLSLAINIGNEGEYGETQFVKLYALHFSPSLHQDQQSSVNSEKNSHLFTTSNENNPLKDIDDQKADISSDPTEYSHSHTTDKEILTVCEQEETNPKVANLSYTDDIYPTLSLFQSSNDTEHQASDDSILCDDEMTAQKSPVKSADDSLVVESPLSSVVQTYGVLKIYDNASITSVTKGNNVLKSLNVTILPNEPDEINPLNPNTIFETQVGSDTDSTVLSENTDPKLLTHDKHCTDSTDITLLTDSVGSRVLTVNTNPTHITGPKSLTDNTDPKALTDNTDPKISTDNTDPKIATDNTDPKISTDNTDPKALTDNTDLSSLTDNTDPKISTDNTDPKISTDNTDPKISTDNANPKSMTDIKNFAVLGKNDTEETFRKTTMASPKNDDSDNLRMHNQDSLNHDSLPFQDIHKFDKQQ
jgi:hypothetical protein